MHKNTNKPVIPAFARKLASKGFVQKGFRKPLDAMDGVLERQDGFMRVCESLSG